MRLSSEQFGLVMIAPKIRYFQSFSTTDEVEKLVADLYPGFLRPTKSKISTDEVEKVRVGFLRPSSVFCDRRSRKISRGPLPGWKHRAAEHVGKEDDSFTPQRMILD